MTSDFVLPVSFNLACELGLEESVLLTYLQQRAHHYRSRQLKMSHRELAEMLPFWTAPYILRLLSSLQMAQKLQFRRTDAGLEMLLETGETTSSVSNTKHEQPSSTRDVGAEKEDVIGKLSRLQNEAGNREQSAVKERFSGRNREPSTASYANVPVAPSTERRGLSDFDLYLEAKERNRQPDQWLPEDATFEQIQQAGIDRPFAESLLAEFLLRIKEQRKNVRTWNSEFFKYVKRQWQYKQSDRQSHEGTATYTTTAKSNREKVSNALTNIHDTDW